MQPLIASVLALAVSVAPGCAILERAAVGAERVGPSQVAQELDRSALTGLEPSAGAVLALHYFGLTKEYERDPEKALVELHRALVADPSRDFVHALAELCFLHGKKTDSKKHFLASAVYAYQYLLGDEWTEAANPYDRRFRWACDLYNRGLLLALLSSDGTLVDVAGGSRELPVGRIEIATDRSAFPADAGFRFVPADTYDLWGLSLRVRDSGLGVPIVAQTDAPSTPAGVTTAVMASAFSPATLFLRITGGLAELEQGVTAALELRSAYDAQKVRVGDHDVPLESDFSTALALALHQSKLWKFSTRGFFESGETIDENCIRLVQPYQPGLIPVLFIHGTASNPAYWAEMFNLLEADPVLRQRYQFWFYLYSTGTPLPFASGRLRDRLADLVAALDPEGRDAALQRMVLVGHSQGGLLVKMMVVDGSVEWTEEIFGRPVEELKLSEKQQELMHWAFDFEPLPFVERTVYLATPHRGSYLADRWFARVVAKTISLPAELTELGEFFTRDDTSLPRGMERRVPTSIDSMKTGNPFLARLARAPIAPGVTAHSIIAIGDADPEHPEDARDGVVAYSSAHLDGVASELCIAGGHSCQQSPQAIREIRRILLEHLGVPARE